MTSGLKVGTVTGDHARTLWLPEEYVTSKVGILAMSGAGKSNAAVLIAEEMFFSNLPWVAIDPKGDWWGIRANATGDGSHGLPIVVFGGLHGDLPLDHQAGAYMADLIAERRLTCVLDVSEMTKGEQITFLTAFAERLLKVNREPLHLFLEEADEYLPQRVMAREAGLVGAWQKIVKRGRFRGLGFTLITQRSAALNKDVLTQIETLIAMRITSPQDRKAILGWVEHLAQGRDLVDALPTLESGEAFIWSPIAFKLMLRLKFGQRTTYDSGATPAAHTRKAPNVTLADVDLAEIKDQMAAVVERSEAEDPKKLKAEIARLRGQVAELQANPMIERMEVPTPYIPEEVIRVVGVIEALHDRVSAPLSEMEAVFVELGRAMVEMDKALVLPAGTPNVATTNLTQWPMPMGVRVEGGAVEAMTYPPRVIPEVPGLAEAIKAEAQRPRQAEARTTTMPEIKGTLPKAEKAFLAVIWRFRVVDKGEHLTQEWLGWFAGYRSGTGHFNNVMSSLRTKGLISEDPLRLTVAGIEALGNPKDMSEVPMLTDYDLLGFWLDKLKIAPKARAMADALFRSAMGLTSEQLAGIAHVQPGTGHANNLVSSLSGKGIAVRPQSRGPLTINPVFLEVV